MPSLRQTWKLTNPCLNALFMGRPFTSKLRENKQIPKQVRTDAFRGSRTKAQGVSSIDSACFLRAVVSALRAVLSL